MGLELELRNLKLSAKNRSYLRAVVDVEIIERSIVEAIVPKRIELRYDRERIGLGTLESGLPSHIHTIVFDWSPNTSKTSHRTFIERVITESNPIPIELRFLDPTAYTDDPYVGISRVERGASIDGLGRNFLKKATVKPGLKLAAGKFDFNFDVENPTESPLSVHSLDIGIKIDGDDIGTCVHEFIPLFVLQPGKKGKTEKGPRIPNGRLNHSIVNPLYLADYLFKDNCDITINSLSVSVGEYQLDGLKFQLNRIPFKLRLKF